jgi:hypothetical protein
MRRVWQVNTSDKEYEFVGGSEGADADGRELAGGTMVVEEVVDDAEMDELDRFKDGVVAAVSFSDVLEGA